MEKLTALVQVHLARGEKVAVERAAQEDRRSVSAWVRGLVLRALAEQGKGAGR